MGGNYLSLPEIPASGTKAFMQTMQFRKKSEDYVPFVRLSFAGSPSHIDIDKVQCVAALWVSTNAGVLWEISIAWSQF